MERAERKASTVRVIFSNVYVYARESGTDVKPKPGRSGAMTWCVLERRGMRFRKWKEEEGKPWRRRMVGLFDEPDER